MPSRSMLWDLKALITIMGKLTTIPLSEIGLFVNLKNIPDYRVLENRLAGGLVFVFEHMTVKPEISVPLDFNLDYARVSVSFVYENLF